MIHADCRVSTRAVNLAVYGSHHTVRVRSNSDGNKKCQFLDSVGETPLFST